MGARTLEKIVKTMNIGKILQKFLEKKILQEKKVAIQAYKEEARTATGASDWIRVNQKQGPFEAHALVDVSGGADLTYTVQFAIEPLVDEQDTSVTAYNLPEMTSKTASDQRVIVAPITGVRLNVTAHTSGTATLRVRQGEIDD